MIPLETVIKPIKGFGRSSKAPGGHIYFSGAHITLPRVNVGREARVTIRIPEPFSCEGCHDTIALEEFFSPDPNLCKTCYRDENKKEEDKKKG